MRKISMLFVLLIIAATPVLADVNQKADLTGENAIEVKVSQTAWNYGNGDIYQNLGVKVSGNYQYLDQDNIVLMEDPEYNVNNTMNGLNIIRVDLDQFAENRGSGITGQGIDILVSQNIQELDQEIIVLIG